MINKKWMIVYFLSGKHFPRSRKHDILVPLSIMGVWKNDEKKYSGWMCKSRDSFHTGAIASQRLLRSLIFVLIVILMCIYKKNDFDVKNIATVSKVWNYPIIMPESLFSLINALKIQW